MTPRALLTAIGATAIGFAVVIGSAAGFSAGLTPSSSTPDSHQIVPTLALIDAGTGMARGATQGLPLRARAGEEDRPIAL